MSARGTDSVESFAHLEAKRLLTAWLREAADAVGHDEYASFCGNALSWRVNRQGPHWGVWQEYPVLADYTGLNQVWDETDLSCPRHGDKGCPGNCHRFPVSRWQNRPPTYDDVIDMGFRPMVVLDIAIQHKGAIAFAIEVVHKHRCNPRKIGFLRDCLTLIEIPAYWVLGQIDRPSEMPSEFFL